ncbi:L-tyrosine/L-aspartate decarboxylase [Methanocaldococcus lauensis]|uniref:Probable L-tyrosine/L-aspartate decarboxylase n=1 Tax=Methanocaldococcus lauensis TaxID=2546128 RepID=A0A8D6Q1R4_9EURY|nr:tyrosine decarboxylase MfnA [Methanocaldococcus lauensis]CAB3289657.1 L-tyrosine/L-aspartate decarboxylase [Methanocaldococcus lauensis]
MQEKGVSEKEIFEELSKYRELDLKYEDGKIFGSMCSNVHPITRKIVDMFLETNLGDPGLFKGTKLLEEKAVKLLGELLNNKNVYGHIVSGGTEANLMALRCIKNIWREKKRKGLTKNEHPKIIVPVTAHFSFEKGRDMMDLKYIYAPLKKDYTVDEKFVKDAVEDYDVDGIVGIAGTTEFGTIDNIEELSKIAKNNEIYIHVDAAFGGLVIPFLETKYKKKGVNYKFDFSLGVDSITIDPHKMGHCPIPSGGILFKNINYRKYLEVNAPYLTETKQTTILGTRVGFGGACTYAVLKYLGREGQRKIVSECMENTLYFYKKLKENSFNPVIEPVLNIITIEDEDYIETCKKLREKGIYVSICSCVNALRIVIMPHIKKEHIDNFIEMLKSVKRK